MYLKLKAITSKFVMKCKKNFDFNFVFQSSNMLCYIFVIRYGFFLINSILIFVDCNYGNVQ